MSDTPEPPTSGENPKKEWREDASTREISLYSIGALFDQVGAVYGFIMAPLLTITMLINPILVGLILAVKTVWDAVTDPVMAHISDNFKSRFGRRRPFMLVGGILAPIVTVVTWSMVPLPDNIVPNVEVEVSEKGKVEAKSDTEASDAAGEVVDEAAQVGEAAATGVASDGLSPEPPPLPSVPEEKKEEEKPKGLFGALAKNFTEGTQRLMETDETTRSIVIFMIVATVLFSLFQTIYSVPYWALGIELAPSYNGRTKVVAYRSVFQKAINLLQPWVLPFCFLPFFAHGIQGAWVLSILIACVLAPVGLFCVMQCKERVQINKKKRPSFIKSVISIGGELTFWRVCLLQIILTTVMGTFIQLGTYLSIFYVFVGDKQWGSVFSAFAGTQGMVLAFAAIPFIYWMCNNLQKHNALSIAYILMMIGTSLNYWCYDPERPWLMFITPFFYSIGISSTYIVIGTLMADLTDLDELNHGVRREAMFGAVMSWILKTSAAFTVIGAGVVLEISGFKAELGADQAEGVFHNMLILYSFVPTALLGFGLLVLYKYPLTRERMEEIRAELRRREEERNDSESDSDGEQPAPAEA